jgi:hypothetical protein
MVLIQLGKSYAFIFIYLMILIFAGRAQNCFVLFVNLKISAGEKPCIVTLHEYVICIAIFQLEKNYVGVPREAASRFVGMCSVCLKNHLQRNKTANATEVCRNSSRVIKLSCVTRDFNRRCQVPWTLETPYSKAVSYQMP